MAEPLSSRERLSLDCGWRFQLGDIPFPVIQGHSDSYANAKAGKAWGAAAPEYDDTTWRKLDLPHDWAVEAPFDPRENVSQGYRRRGVSWYRRHFALESSDRGKHLELQFDGIATHCTVWFNGIVVARNWCGYTSFHADITPMARYEDSVNTIAVRVDANAMEGWWYEGAGIYRHTWLVKRNPVHIATDGVYANPVRDGAGAWSLPVEVTLENSGSSAVSVEIESELTGPPGTKICLARASASVRALEQTVARFSMPVPSPKLWSVDDPVLYRVRTVVLLDGRPVDEIVTPCGFRTLRFDADKGFFLNDRPLKLKGVCNHQDHAGVGVAMPDSLWEFRVRKLKEMGVNACRCAHNPPPTEFVDQCDRLGVLVMDENRNFNSSLEYMRQIEWLVRRDRNHPSVFLWAIFNEEPMQGTEVGYEMVRRMAAVVKQLDATRPVTAAMNGGLFNPANVSQVVDVVGINYQIPFYDRFHEANPNVPLTSSEDTSAFMTRGEYVTDLSRNVLGSYDTECAPWGATHRNAWRAVAERSFLGGGFVWTGFDYRGEPTPLQWPSASSFFGCMDLCGFPKSAFYIHQAQWVEHKPVLRLIPHWNWDGKEGQPVEVMACANADSVALFLNGEPLGEKPLDKYEMVSWQVPFRPGRLEAVGKKNGLEVSRFAVETSGAPALLRLTAYRDSLAGDGCDAAPVTVEVCDKQGRPVPTASLPVEFEITGPASIIGLGNGDPNCHEPEKGCHRSLFNGLAQVIIQSWANAAGDIVVRAKAPGVASAEVKILSLAAATPFRVSDCEPVLALQIWRMSPLTTTAPDPNVEVPENDMNTWVTILPGELQSYAGGRWAIYRIRFQPFAAVQTSGGRLSFKSIRGMAEVWLDGRLAGKKETLESAPLTVLIPPRNGDRMLSVLIETVSGQPAGFDGSVTVEPKP